MLAFEALASSSAGNLYHVTSKGHAPLLIEAGVAFKTLRRLLAFKVRELAGVLISHAHGDHSRSVKDLLAAGVNVYASPETGEALGITEHHNFAPLTAGQATQVGPWRVLPFELVHDVPCLGFLVADQAGERLAYISDTAYVPVRMERLAIVAIEANYSRGILDHLIEQGTVDQHHAARVIRNHLSVEHAAAFLAASDLTQAREVHLLHLSGGSSDARAFKEQIERIVGVPVHVAAERSAA